MSERQPDVVVVGGGIIGLALSYELLRRGRTVLLVERECATGSATRASAGMLAPISEAEVEDAALIELGLESLRRYPRFIAEIEELTHLGCGYRSEGTLWVALNRDDLEELAHMDRTLRLKSLSASRLEAQEVLEREPHLSGRVVGGLRVDGDRQVDPRALSRCLRGAIERLGGSLRTGEVTEVEAEQGRVVRGVVVRAGSGETSRISSPVVVLAAGAWTGEQIRSPLPSLGIRPVKGQLVRLRGGSLLRHVVRTPRVYLVPREDGELLLGATMEEQGFDTSPTAGAVLDLLRHAWQVLPGIYDLEVSEISVGLRPAVGDHLPVIGPTEIEGLYLATAHYRNGVLLAPATAQYLSEWITTGRPAGALAPFLPSRLQKTVPGTVSDAGSVRRA